MSLKKDKEEPDWFKQLSSLSRRWYPKPSKKFNTKFVKDIQTILEKFASDSRYIFQYLHDTRYFDNVLWHFFHEDISATHLLLILKLVLFDNEENTGLNLKYILSDELKFHKFSDRLLSISIDSKESSDFALHRLVIDFFHESFFHPLISQISDSLKTELLGPRSWKNINHYKVLLEEEGIELNEFENQKHQNGSKYSSLKDKWFYSLVVNFMSLLGVDSLVENCHFLEYLKSLLSFLIQCILLPLTARSTSIMLKSLNFIGCYNKAFCLHLGLYFEVLYHCGNRTFDLGIHAEKNFQMLNDNLHQIYGGSNDSQVASFFKVNSAYTCSMKFLADVLQSFSIQDLLSATKNFVCFKYLPDAFLKKDFIINVILRAVRPLDVRLGCPYLQLTEKDIFDCDAFLNTSWLEKGSQKVQVNDLINTNEYYSSCDFKYRMSTFSSMSFSFGIRQHAETVLNRFKVVGETDDSIKLKGTSKYVTKIEKVDSVREQFIQLRILNDKQWTPMSINSDLLMLIEVIKPNKYSPYLRYVRYGLGLIRFGRVLNISASDGKIIIDLRIAFEPSMLPRFNYVMKLPPNFMPLYFCKFVEEQCLSMKFEMTSFLESLMIPNTLKQKHIMTNGKKRSVSNTDLELEQNENLKRSKKSENLNVVSTRDINFIESFPESFFNDNGSEDKDKDRDIFLDNVINPSPQISFVDSPLNSEEPLYSELVQRIVSTNEYNRVLIVCSTENQMRSIILPVSLSLIKVFESDLLQQQSIDRFWADYEAKLNEARQICLKIDPALNQDELSTDFVLSFLPRIKEVWSLYLSSIEKNKKNIKNFPFSHSLQGLTLENIAESYSSILSLFHKLKAVADLKKFRSDTKQVMQYILKKHCRIVLTTFHLLQELEIYRGAFDVIIVTRSIPETALLAPIVHNRSLRKLIVVGDHAYTKATFAFPRSKVFKYSNIRIRQEFLDRIRNVYPRTVTNKFEEPNYNPGIKHTYQVIPSKSNVEEAEFITLMYFYMCLIGYPPSRITVVATNAYQKKLIEEVILSKRKLLPQDSSAASQFLATSVDLIENFAPNDYILLSAHGNAYIPAKYFSRASCGFYIFGSVHAFLISPSYLELIPNEAYGRGRVRPKRPTNANSVLLKSVDQFEQYIESLDSSVKSS